MAKAECSSPLAEFTGNLDLASPIRRKNAGAYITVKRRMRPIADASDQAVLDGVDIAIFNMARVVGLIADQVLPETALPDPSFSARNPDRGEPFAFGQRPREARLDQSLTRREIGLPGRQRQHRMEMVRQHHERVDCEGETLSRGSDGQPQKRAARIATPRARPRGCGRRAWRGRAPCRRASRHRQWPRPSPPASTNRSRSSHRCAPPRC
jgi:hypothetical protein